MLLFLTRQCYSIRSQSKVLSWKVIFWITKKKFAMSRIIRFCKCFDLPCQQQDWSCHRMLKHYRCSVRYSKKHTPRHSKECNMRSKFWWFTEFCNSHYVSHFTAFFIVTRAKISIAKSHVELWTTQCGWGNYFSSWTFLTPNEFGGGFLSHWVHGSERARVLDDR